MIGINGILSYEGQSISEIRQDFQETVDWYLKIARPEANSLTNRFHALSWR